MKNLYLIVALSAILMVTSGCSSKGMQKLPIQSALDDSRVNGQLDPNVRLSFGDNGGGGKLWTSNKKTNAVNKEVDEGCNRAFMSAVIALQDRAKKEGKTSVIDIHSFYKSNKFSSSTEFECEAGAVMSGVALRGRVQ